MSDIVTIAAVAGPFVGAAIGFALADPWQDWTIKRLNKDRNDLRRLLTAEQKATEHYARRVKEANHENSLLHAELALAGKPDQPRDALGRYVRLPKAA